ncbi:hypothetical protein DFH07DRAFT_958643 [Mycena maculata]|uniref:Uncharacterized protein n=1 Tax=Mycena maculata TaxID=230809 RepID=A0AAD7NFB0_9AGAR|nr:hypothetical protein DFH07DRAFT_958643 [Mycena maculata]
MSDLLDTFRSALNVVELSLEDMYKRAEDTNALVHYTPVTLGSLCILSFENTETPFLPYMVIPALRELTGGFGLIDDVNFLTRTGPSYTHLTLHPKTAESERLLHALGVTSNVTNLTLYFGGQYYCMDENFMRGLTCGPGTRNLVPSVVSLALGYYFRCEGNLLLEMLKSRCTPGPLRSIKLRGWPSKPSDLCAFETLRWDQGLELIDARVNPG